MVMKERGAAKTDETKGKEATAKTDEAPKEPPTSFQPPTQTVEAAKEATNKAQKKLDVAQAKEREAAAMAKVKTAESEAKEGIAKVIETKEKEATKTNEGKVDPEEEANGLGSLMKQEALSNLDKIKKRMLNMKAGTTISEDSPSALHHTTASEPKDANAKIAQANVKAATAEAKLKDLAATVS